MRIVICIWAVAVSFQVALGQTGIVRETPVEEVVQVTNRASQFPDEMYKSIDWSEFENWEAVNKLIDPSQVDYNLLNAAVFYYSNQYRQSKGLPILQFSPELRDAAVFHSLQMVNRRFYDHDNPYDRNFRTTSQRISYFGFEGGYYAENIAYQFLYNYKGGEKYWYTDLENGERQYHYGTSRRVDRLIPQHTYLSFAEALVDQWVNSKGHRQNLLGKDYQYLGCGVIINPNAFGTKEIPKAVSTQNLGG